MCVGTIFVDVRLISIKCKLYTGWVPNIEFYNS